MTRHCRDWTHIELRRMGAAITSGVPVREIARRFATSDGRVTRLAREHGWRIPHAAEVRPPPRNPGLTPKGRALAVRQACIRRHADEQATFDDRMAAARCRHLVCDGVAIDAEAARRKAELEERDREERKRKQAWDSLPALVTASAS